MILDEVEKIIREYVILSDPQYVSTTLWVAATHGIDMWEHATRLAILSPVKGCGKTRLIEVLTPLSYEPLSVLSTTVAALYRTIDSGYRTIFHDEVDTIFGPRAVNDAEDLRAFYNGGFSHDFPAMRCVGTGSNMKVKAFSTFSMAALASKTHDLPDTIQDRAVVIRMRKRMNGETVADLRRKHKARLEDTGVRLGEWVENRRDQIESTEPVSKLVDRAADVWEPLLRIADAAGSKWAARARKAAAELAQSEKGSMDEDPGLRMLGDIRRVWPSEDVLRLSTHDLLHYLTGDAQSDWNRYDHGRDITVIQLASLLRPYQIKPKLMKVGGQAVRGYRRDQFVEAWQRYLT